MGATLSNNVESFKAYTRTAYDVKNKNLSIYTGNLKQAHFWADLNSPERNVSNLAQAIKELIQGLDLNRNDTYLVRSLISFYYEDILAQAISNNNENTLRTALKHANEKIYQEQIKSAKLLQELEFLKEWNRKKELKQPHPWLKSAKDLEEEQLAFEDAFRSRYRNKELEDGS